MTLLGTIILTVAALFVIAGNPRSAVLSLFVCTLFLTQGQQVQFLAVNFYAVRIIETLLFLRILARREYRELSVTTLDKLLFTLYLLAAVVPCLRSGSVIMEQLGRFLDHFLCYFSFRALIRTHDNFVALLKHLVFLLVPFALFTIIETLTQYNVFRSMGGVYFDGDVWMRDGRLRSQASFRQASLLGTVGACIFPAYAVLSLFRQTRWFGILGSCACVAIVWSANSGTPLAGLLIGSASLVAWHLRQHTKKLVTAAIILLILAASVMKAPIWYLIAKASSITGGAGWHRSRLMEVAFEHLDEWWLAGIPISETSDWLPYTLSITGGTDITNQYLAFGIQAGLAGTLLFLYTLLHAFQRLSRTVSSPGPSVTDDQSANRLTWSLGASLAVHTATFFAITYFDQTYVIWCWHLAMISSLTSPLLPTHQVSSSLPSAGAIAEQRPALTYPSARSNLPNPS